jgi:hypothetical protein
MQVHLNPSRHRLFPRLMTRLVLAAVLSMVWLVSGAGLGLLDVQAQGLTSIVTGAASGGDADTSEAAKSDPSETPA